MLCLLELSGFYCKDVDMADEAEIKKIERIENGLLHENMDSSYGTQHKIFKTLGIELEGGLHTKWLFHGTGTADVLQEIVEDPSEGFSALLNERGLWGKGARSQSLNLSLSLSL